MAKKVFLFVSLFFIGICIFFSCTKVEEGSGFPRIEYVSIDSLTPLKSGDIVYTDSLYSLKSTFVSKEKLSSYTIQIWNAIMKSPTDTFTLKSSVVILPEGTADSAIYNSAFQNASIWGIQDTPVDVYTPFKIDSTLTVSQKKRPILLGNSYLRVTVVDVYGGIADETFLIYLKRKKIK